MLTMTRSRRNGNSEAGFTMIELLVVLIVIGILLAIAVPSYIGFRDRAANDEAKTSLREALPAAEAYLADNGSYSGMTTGALLTIDAELSPTLVVTSADADSYCLTDTVRGRTWSVAGPHPASGDFHAGSDCG
jgi:type IV pilus assembly protein PilA